METGSLARRESRPALRGAASIPDQPRNLPSPKERWCQANPAARDQAAPSCPRRTRGKYTLSHELGHAFVVEGNETSNLNTLLGCSYGSGGPTSHTILSPEWQSCAQYEGLST